ncbi:hypothetical protein ACFO9E_18100 [Streptomyces maoxianensis]|uniref:Uncharacterized protein n=1 Tax=Streptomyces maoxianensis TaxID=1459942 RepID=A0ABV9G5W3_9ACTN
MLVALYFLLIVGLAASVGFLVLHRPRRMFRAVEINSTWWVIILGLLYARSLVLLVIRGYQPSGGWVDALFVFGMLAAIDALLILRFVTYLAYLRKHPEKNPAPVS